VCVHQIDRPLRDGWARRAFAFSQSVGVIVRLYQQQSLDQQLQVLHGELVEKRPGGSTRHQELFGRPGTSVAAAAADSPSPGSPVVARVECSSVFAKGRARPKLAVSVGCPTVLLIADPGFAAELAKQIADSLPNELADRVDPPLRCNISVRVEPYLPDEQAPFPQVIESVDASRHDADIVIYLTDLPRRDDTLPVIADISSKHRFALISVPGLGATFVPRQVREVVALVIGEMIGVPDLATGAPRGFHIREPMGRPATLPPGGCADFACWRAWCAQIALGAW